jgi:hypothetical protein
MIISSSENRDWGLEIEQTVFNAKAQRFKAANSHLYPTNLPSPALFLPPSHAQDNKHQQEWTQHRPQEIERHRDEQQQLPI